MVITNKYSLPKAFVNFVNNEKHNKEGCISATTLLQGCKQIVLTDRHFDEIEQDVSKMIFALFGTSVHSILEEQVDDYIKEQMFSVKVGEWNITGKVDRYSPTEHVLEDWKTTSVWKFIYQSFDDWQKQGLIYAWLMRQSGVIINKCRFVCFLKDWSETEALRKENYPKAGVGVYEFDVTAELLADIERFIKEKVEQITVAYKLSDDEISPCSAQERWEEQTKFAVMKKGRKSALKLFDTKEEAERYALENDSKNCFVEERKGCSKKCLSYCACKNFCDFYKSINE